MTYTTSKKADKQIEKEIKIVTDIIREELNPISIILVGGLGKGEASLYKGKLFNDIDVYVVTKKNVSSKRLEKVGIKASNAICRGGLEFMEHYNQVYDAKIFFHVDIRAIKYSKLRKLKKTTRAFELKYSSKILYGEDVRYLINITKSDLSLSEGIRHLINKSCLLLMVMDLRRMNGNFIKDEKQFMIYHSIKTFLGCAEALLLAKGDDAPTYRGRNELFKKYYQDEFPDFVKEVDFATKFKMNLRFEKIENPVQFWKNARNFLDFTLKYIAKNNLNIDFIDRIDLVRKLYKKLPHIYFKPYLPLGSILFPLQYFLNILYFKKTKYFRVLFSWRDIGVRILFPAYLLLFSIEDPALNFEVKKYLLDMTKIAEYSWEGLRESLLYVYKSYFSQKLI